LWHLDKFHYECLVINNNSKSNKLNEQVYWYKAEPHSNFKIGAPQFWKYSQENYSKEDQNSNEGYFENKKNKFIVNKE